MRTYFNIFILFVCLLYIKNEPVSINEINIPDGVFNILLKKKYTSISFRKEIRLTRDKLGSEHINFRFRKVRYSNNITYYTFEHLKTKLYLGIKTDNKGANFLIFNSEIVENKTLSFEFTFKKIENNVYIIQNKNGCYLKGDKLKVICVHEEPPKSLTHFHLLKIFTEVRKSKNDELILEKEPIDVLIKYIDLSDPNLVREGIRQIKKDNENEELKYSIRSILKNIP